jgi:hypothetical protein
MTTWNKITGTIKYEDGWYARCELPSSLGWYLRKLVWMQKKSRRILIPEGGTHITFIKREIPTHKQFWRRYHNFECTIYYSLEVGNNRDAYYWLSINPVFLYDIRQELGLPKKPRYPLHLSYGIDQSFIDRRQNGSSK